MNKIDVFRQKTIGDKELGLVISSNNFIGAKLKFDIK